MEDYGIAVLVTFIITSIIEILIAVVIYYLKKQKAKEEFKEKIKQDKMKNEIEIEKYRNRIVELQNKNEQLNKELKNQNKENDELNQDNNSYYEENKKLYDINEKLTKRLRRYEENERIDFEINEHKNKQIRFLIETIESYQKQNDKPNTKNFNFEASEENKPETKDFRKKYPANFRCKDGHYVRSKSEREIDDFLFEHNINHIYEKEYFNEEEHKKFCPDFTLPDQNLIIEYFGLYNNEYSENKEEKIKIYSNDSRYKFEYLTNEDDFDIVTKMENICNKYSIQY